MARGNRNRAALVAQENQPNMTPDELKKAYEKNEAWNHHSENVILLARQFGTKEDEAKAEAILDRHMKDGEMTTENGKERDTLLAKLKPKFDAYVKSQGLIASEGGLKAAQNQLDAGIKEINEMKDPNDRVQAARRLAEALAPTLGQANAARFAMYRMQDERVPLDQQESRLKALAEFFVNPKYKFVVESPKGLTASERDIKGRLQIEKATPSTVRSQLQYALSVRFPKGAYKSLTNADIKNITDATNKGMNSILSDYRAGKFNKDKLLRNFYDESTQQVVQFDLVYSKAVRLLGTRGISEKHPNEKLYYPHESFD